LRSFAAAARLQPDSAEYQLCEKWTEFLLRPPASADETLLLLDKLALSTLRQDKRNAFAYYVHGRVAHAQGDSESAKSALKIAIKLDPSNFEAKTFLHALLRR
jgi:cytochrome c-type biogenesis protein CcmH/NrfG